MSDLSSNSLAFIHTTVDPSVDVLPPTTQPTSGFSKAFDLEGKFHISDAALTGEKVSTHRGALIWSPQRGLESFTRLGFVNSGTVSAPVAAHTITYNKEIALPYVIGENVNIAPRPEENFSFARLFAGRIKLYSSTISATNLTLNGWFGSGNIADIRDIFDQSSSNEVFNVPTLNQQSISKKDAYKSVSVSDGMVTTVGCDLPVNFSPPSTDSVTNVRGAIARKNYSVPVNILAHPVPCLIRGVYRHEDGIGVHWVSPYDTTYTNPGTVAGLTSTTWKSDMVNPFGEPSFRVGIQPNLVYTPDSQTHSNGMGVTVTHWYATLSSGVNIGSIEYTYVTESHDFVSMFNYGGTSSNYFSPYHKFTPIMHPFNHRGCGIAGATADDHSFYVGSSVEPYVNMDSTDDGVPTTFDLTGHYDIIIEYHAKDIYSPGELGPMRVIRWDEVGDDQVLNLGGRLMVECVAEGAIAPYVNSSMVTNHLSYNVNLYGLLNMLYNGDNPYFHRIYTLREYEQVINTLRSGSIADIITGHSSYDTRMKMIAQAAGVFEELGTRIGGMFSHADKGAHIGGVIDNALPYAEKLLGSAAGQFGGNAMGQFGEAAGQFGLPSMKRTRY